MYPGGQPGYGQQFGQPYDASNYPMGQQPPPYPGTDRPPRENCFLVSCRGGGGVLSVENSNVDPGTKALVQRQTNPPQDNQLWFEDFNTGTIKSRLNILCLDLQETAPSYQLMKSQRRPPAGAVCLAQQTDGGGAHYSAVANTSWGAIPGKAKGGSCWYAYGGREHVTSDFSFITSSGAKLMDNPSGPPPSALGVGNQTDGSGVFYAAVARTPNGTIPGKAQGATCWYPYAGKEHFTSDFSWVVAESNHVMMNTYIPGKPSQQWVRTGDKIQNRQDANKVLQGSAQVVTAVGYSGVATQLWTFPACPPQAQPAQPYAQPVQSYAQPAQPYAQPFTQPMVMTPQPVVMKPQAPVMAQPMQTRRHFFIKSCMHGKVLDIQGGSSSPGTMVIMWPQKSPPSDNQLWYQDDEGFVRSKLTNFALQPSGHGIWVQPYTGQQNQKWTVQGNKIVLSHNPNVCLDIHGADRKDGAKIIKCQYKSSANQHWTFVYV